MTASVVSLANVRERLGFRRWSNQDVAEIYRVADTLRRAGLPVECDEGQTDEGDSWYAFCNENTGDVIIHFAHIDGHYVAEVSQLGVSFKGDSLGEIVSQFLSSYPVVLPNQKSPSTRMWMHPARGFVAFIATLYFLLEMTHSAEAREAASGLTIDGEGGEFNPYDDSNSTGDLAAYHREQMLRSARHEGAASWDGYRSVAVSAAILIAGVLMDWHRTSEAAVAFDPESILDAILTKSGDELGDAIIMALREMAGLDESIVSDIPTSDDGASVRTAHLVTADGVIADIGALDVGIIGIDEDAQLIIDVDGEFGDPGRAIGAELVSDEDIGAGGAEAGIAGGSAASVEDRVANTIAVSIEDEEVGGEGGEDQDAALDSETLGSSDNPNFLDQASQGSTIALLESLGLKSGTSGLGADSDAVVLLQLVTGQPETSSNSDAVTEPPNSRSDPSFNVAIVETPDIGGTDPTPVDATAPVSESTGNSAPTASSRSAPVVTSDLTDTSSPIEPAPLTATSDAVQPSYGGNSNHGNSGHNDLDYGNSNYGDSDCDHSHHVDGRGEFEYRDYDLSFFDPVEVLRLFVETVDKVGFAHLNEIFYLYDAVAIATEPETLEIEQLYLANGDEVNLLGQADTFGTIYDALA